MMGNLMVNKARVCGRLLAGIVGSNPTGARTRVSFQGCVLWGRGLCVGLMTRPDEFYRMWCVWMWSWSPVPLGAVAPLQKIIGSEIYSYIYCTEDI